MLNPLLKYKEYHKNEMNILIHKICVPLLLASIYSVIPLYISLIVNIFYSLTYILFDVFSKKSIHSLYYLQLIFIVHFIFREFVSFRVNILIHIISWISQIIGHRKFENNTPAFLDNLSDSFLFAPYFTFLETFYPYVFESKDKYTIIRNNYDNSKKSIIYFAGLFQKAEIEYNGVSDNLSSYNHIYINTHFNKNDIYKNTLINIINDLDDLNIECIIGFSFGGSLSLQFKELYIEKKNKEIKTILISPAGFESNTLFEKTIKVISKYLYSFFLNDKWYMIKNYPKYQNNCKLTNTDYIIISTSDHIHNPLLIKEHTNNITLKHASHLNMIEIIKKQKIISQIINNNYEIENVTTKPLTSKLNKLLFGGHFYPYNSTLWGSVSIYNLYYFIKNNNSYISLFYGFLLSAVLWSFTEYMFHRYLLHKFLYIHHKKHHVYPNKLSIINTPMTMVTLNWIVYFFILKVFINEEIIKSYYIFFPLNYLSFEITHLLSHKYRGKNKIILNAKYYHKLHHIDENVNYSFITPFWDYFLGTLSPKYNVNIIELLFGFIPFYSFLIHKINT